MAQGVTLLSIGKDKSGEEAIALLGEKGWKSYPVKLGEKGLLVVAGNKALAIQAHFQNDGWFEDVQFIDNDAPLSSYNLHPDPTIIKVGSQEIGGNNFTMMAGPCSVETEAQILEVAKCLSENGVGIIRGGAFKPRTSPYSFQGLGIRGLELMRNAADAYNLKVITEVIDTSLIDTIAPYADIIQIGARNMFNYHLLKNLAKVEKPILLKRGMASTLEEFLLAAEYLLGSGNGNVMLCERGIRTFDPVVRNTLDLTAIPWLKARTHLPIMVDPSHGTGHRALVLPMSLAAIAAGAHGLLVEVHPNPDEALSDGAQSIYLKEVPNFVATLHKASQTFKAL